MASKARGAAASVAAGSELGPRRGGVTVVVERGAPRRRVHHADLPQHWRGGRAGCGDPRYGGGDGGCGGGGRVDFASNSVQQLLLLPGPLGQADELARELLDLLLERVGVAALAQLLNLTAEVGELGCGGGGEAADSLGILGGHPFEDGQWLNCPPGDSLPKGVVVEVAGFAERSFRPPTLCTTEFSKASGRSRSSS